MKITYVENSNPLADENTFKKATVVIFMEGIEITDNVLASLALSFENALIPLDSISEERFNNVKIVFETKIVSIADITTICSSVIQNIEVATINSSRTVERQGELL